MPYRTTRRNFLAGGCAAGVAYFLRRAEAFAQGAGTPKRLLVIHHPVGTIRPNWICSGTETNFQLSRILMPFAPVKSHMVVLDGIDIIAPGNGGGHERGTVVMMTGVRTGDLYPSNGGDDPKSGGPSVDQLFLNQSPALKGPPIASLQVSCDDRVDVGEWSTRRLSYSGPAMPMAPYLVPHLTYERVFGEMMPGTGGDPATDALRAARLRKQSVLDFSLGDLRKLRDLAPAAERVRLDAHEAAIREIEKELDGAPEDPNMCGAGDKPPTLSPFTDGQRNRIGNGTYSTTTSNVRDDVMHEMIGNLHFAVIRAAFRCDLTRVVTFQWSPGTNHVSFQGMYPGQPDSIKMHHPLSHEFNNPEAPEFLTNVDTWYSTKTAALLKSLLDTEETAGGSNLLDNTFVPYVTEVAKADHTFENAPFLVFGGAGVKVQGDRLKKYSPRRPLNDMWLAAAKALDVPMTTLGESDMYTGPLNILTS